jgi:AcrR family transcriptional regulator
MKQDVEKKIIDAARELFYEKGFTGVTVRDIASKAEVNLALLHYYFRTKDKIFEIVFKDAFALLFKKLNKALSSDVSLLDKIRLIVESYITTAAKYPRLASFIMHEMSGNKDIVWQIINLQADKKNINNHYSMFFHEIREAGQNGLIKDIDPKILFVDIMSLSLFPFIADVFMTGFLYSEKKSEFNKMMKDRVEHVSGLIINSLKV